MVVESRSSNNSHIVVEQARGGTGARQQEEKNKDDGKPKTMQTKRGERLGKVKLKTPIKNDNYINRRFFERMDDLEVQMC
jgi:hypothetical protein